MQSRDHMISGYSLSEVFKILVSLEIKPRGFDQAIFHFEHRDAVDWPIVDAVDQFVIEHFVAQHGSRQQFGAQRFIVETMVPVKCD